LYYTEIGCPFFDVFFVNVFILFVHSNDFFMPFDGQKII